MMNSLKVALATISVSLVLLVVQGVPPEEMEAKITKCLEVNNLDENDFKTEMSKNITEAMTEEVDNKKKCFLYCMATELDVIGSNGYLDVELVEKKEKLDEKARATYFECKELYDGDTDLCQYAFLMTVCLMQKLNAHE